MRYFAVSAPREADLAALDGIPKVVLDRDGSELLVSEADAALMRHVAQAHGVTIEGDESLDLTAAIELVRSYSSCSEGAIDLLYELARRDAPP